jgi:hypothetical protein
MDNRRNELWCRFIWALRAVQVWQIVKIINLKWDLCFPPGNYRPAADFIELSHYVNLTFETVFLCTFKYCHHQKMICEVSVSTK